MAKEVVTVKPEVFQCVLKSDLNTLREKCAIDDLIPIYPSLLYTFNAINESQILAPLCITLAPAELDILEIIRVDCAAVMKQMSTVTDEPPTSFELSDAATKVRMVCAEMAAAKGAYRVPTKRKQPTGEKWLIEVTARRSFRPLDDAWLFDACCAVLWRIGTKLSNLFSWDALVELLLLYDNGPLAVQRLVANQPIIFDSVVDTIVRNAADTMQPSFLVGLDTASRERALGYLCSMSPDRAYDIVELCIKYHRLIAFSLRTALQYLSLNCVVKVLGQLLLKDSGRCKWFARFVFTAQEPDRRFYDPVVADVSSALFRRVEQVLETVLPSGEIDPASVAEAMELMRLVCKLRCLTDMRFTDEQMAALVRLVCSRPGKCVLGSNFISDSLITLIVVSTMPKNILGSCESLVKDWIQWVVSSEEEFQNCMQSGLRSYSELLLLLALHLDASYSCGIEELVLKALDLKVSIQNNHMDRLRSVLTEKVLNEAFIVERVTKMKVTSNLNATTRGFLTIHCVIELLSCRAFSKNEVRIADWIFQQLLQCTTPVHSAVAHLIHAYVESCLVPSGRGVTCRAPNLPIAEERIAEFFQNTVLNERHIVNQVLLLYYVLCHGSVYWKNYKRIVASGQKPKLYSESLMDSIPFVYLMGYVAHHSQDYALIFPKLSSMMFAESPFLCTAFFDSYPEQMSRFGKCSAKAPTVRQVHIAALRSATDQDHSLAMIKYLMRVPPEKLVHLVPQIALYGRRLLDDRIAEDLLVQYRKLWLKVEYYFPRKLHLYTVGALLATLDERWTTVDKEHFVVGHGELCDNPLLVLSCDGRVFRRAPICDITLRILRCYLQSVRLFAERKQMTLMAQGDDGSGRSEEEKELRLRDLFAVKISGVQMICVQTLLEVCIPTEEEEEKQMKQSMQTGLREIQSTVCSFIHELFLSTPDLMKQIHFQGYKRALIPIAVKGIPSMHMCLHFLPEMLMRGSMSSKAFAVELLASLCEQYSIHQALLSALACYDVLTSIAELHTRSVAINFFWEIYDALLRICRVLPTVSMEISKLSTKLMESEPKWNDDVKELDTKATELRLKIQAALEEGLIRSILPVDC